MKKKLQNKILFTKTEREFLINVLNFYEDKNRNLLTMSRTKIIKDKLYENNL